eukprot:gnl/Spiro4/21701_TR10625_c0_g2_i1.p1 gnl/Spiro4/21701_TR10625_c0_g2~~gnl/Spiro4/21701_TR10625_c0_g2_i1.p1  ORF type:complete len:313 (-),score=78.07 gnl/Spiro4/21701_TR10625_c0_g2_i1:36-944(-)
MEVWCCWRCRFRQHLSFSPGVVRSDAAFVRLIGTAGRAHGQFKNPHDVCVSNDGELLVVADQGNKRVQLLTRDCLNFVRAWERPARAHASYRQWPASVCVSSSGNLIVTDTNEHTVEIFSIDGRSLRKFGSHGDADGQFSNPWRTCVDRDDNIIVTDGDNHRIQVFSSHGVFLRKFGTRGCGNGQFYSPAAVCVNSGGDIIVADTWNHRIQQFRSDGTFVGAFHATPRFEFPSGICVDGADSIFVADNHRVQQFRSDGALVRVFGDRGDAPGQFSHPSGVCVDARGSLFVAEYGNNRIQEFR